MHTFAHLEGVNAPLHERRLHFSLTSTLGFYTAVRTVDSAVDSTTVHPLPFIHCSFPDRLENTKRSRTRTIRMYHSTATHALRGHLVDPQLAVQPSGHQRLAVRHPGHRLDALHKDTTPRGAPVSRNTMSEQLSAQSRDSWQVAGLFRVCFFRTSSCRRGYWVRLEPSTETPYGAAVSGRQSSWNGGKCRGLVADRGSFYPRRGTSSCRARPW